MFLTSFSKKPERSRHEDIPINWNALMWVYIFPWSSISAGFRQKNKKQKYCILVYRTKYDQYTHSCNLFDWEGFIIAAEIFIVIIWDSRNIIPLKPTMCFDFIHIDPGWSVWVKDSPEQVLSTRRKPVRNVCFTLKNLNKLSRKFMS